jgi:hypothetical protein
METRRVSIPTARRHGRSARVETVSVDWKPEIVTGRLSLNPLEFITRVSATGRVFLKPKLESSQVGINR